MRIVTMRSLVGAKAVVAARVLAFSALLAGAGALADSQNSSPWGARYFPNVPLITQDGNTVRFYDDLIKDKQVLVNFIYVTCDKACPLSTAKLAQLQERLGPRVGRDIFFYSITLDPEHDTPEALKEYASRFGAGPGWLFLTGKSEYVDAVRYKLGQRSEKELHHNDILLGSKGTWMKSPLFDDVDVIATRIRNWLEDQDRSAVAAHKPAKSFADAPHMNVPEEKQGVYLGQSVFLAKCAACHTFGHEGRVGPDLKGVTNRRERGWIANYLLAPDKMRAGNDPIAAELHAKYKDVVMPDLGLNENEVADLLVYLEAQTDTKKQTGPAPAGNP